MEIGVREFRKNLSSYLKQVRGGAMLLITERGEPVARLMPPAGELPLSRLIDAGVEFYYNSMPASALLSNGDIHGAVFGGKPGLFAIEAGLVIDCSPSWL